MYVLLKLLGGLKMLFFTCVSFALLYTCRLVQAGGSNEEMEENLNACLRLFSPEVIKEGCCDLNKIFEDDNPAKECKKDHSKEWICEESECVLKQFKVMKDDQIDYETMKEIQDKFLEKNPDAMSLVENVQRRCAKGKFEDALPEELCLAMKFQVCVYLNSAVECPKWKDNDKCRDARKDAVKCKELLDKMEAE